MPNKMLDSHFCECGTGQYLIVDTEMLSSEIIEDSYQCDSCFTWCIVKWDAETGDEISRVYEEE